MRIIRYICIFTVLLLASCVSPIKVVYFQDAKEKNVSDVSSDYELKIKKDDVLSIAVTSKSPELVSVFNMSSVSNIGSSNVSTTQNGASYNVDVDGCIKFPILGKIKVEGMTCNQLVEHIETSLIMLEYVKDPTAIVRVLNFKVSVLGEVKNPGIYVANSERFTILDAISMAGDLTIYGKRDKVALIREVDGKRTVSYHDLRSSDIFESPDFYLQQNDVVYVEPNKARSSQSGIFSNVSLWISIVSVAVSFTILLLR